jgi:hypothetical protein
MTSWRAPLTLIVLVLASIGYGCDKPEPIDAGATRAYWTDHTHLMLPMKDGPAASRVLAAAEELDRLSGKGVDPKLVQFSREVSVFYRRHAKFMNDAFERGRKGEGFNPDQGETKSLSDESNRIAKKLLEIDKYVRDTYHY